MASYCVLLQNLNLKFMKRRKKINKVTKKTEQLRNKSEWKCVEFPVE